MDRSLFIAGARGVGGGGGRQILGRITGFLGEQKGDQS